jgi:hypothetical protein
MDSKELTGEKASANAASSRNLADSGGNLNVGISIAGSCNSSSHGYVMGGESLESSSTNNIKHFLFPFNDGESSESGILFSSRKASAGWNSSSHGYCVGGSNINFIDKFQFASSVGQSSVATNLSSTKGYMASCNSSLFGYTFGGNRSVSVAEISKYEFGVFAATNMLIGQLNTSRYGCAGVNSSKNGYVSGGTTYGTDNIGTSEGILFPFESGYSQQSGSLSGNRRFLSSTDNVDFVSLLI